VGHNTGFEAGIATKLIKKVAVIPPSVLKKAGQ
jgi:hypothetical protein